MEVEELDDKRKWIVIIIVIAIIASILIAYQYSPYSWGDKGTLEISISLDKTNITINNTINATVTIENIGDTKIRILSTYDGGSRMDVYYKSNGTLLERNDVFSRYFIPPDNSRLIIIEPGQNYTFTNLISPPDDDVSYIWMLSENTTYFAQARFLKFSDSYYEDITLPHWTGELESNTVDFHVE